MDEMKYGTLINRVKAAIVDSLLIMGLVLIVSTILSKFENVPDFVRVILFILIFILYDPLLTSTIGATIGHLFLGLRIRRSNDEDRKIIFPIAIVRFILKALLGWISLLTITVIKKKKAIHDLVAGSVVLQSTDD